MPTNDYQEFVKLIEQSLHSKNAKVTCPAFIKGQGLEHFREVDILIEDSFGPHNIKMAVEATDLGERLGVAKYDSLCHKYRGPGRVAVDKFIVVTRLGFTEDTLEKALLDDVELITLDAAKEADWPMKFNRQGTAVAALPVYVCAVGFDPPITAEDAGQDLRELMLRCSHGTDMGKAGDYAIKFFKHASLKAEPDAVERLTEAAKTSPNGIAHLEDTITFKHQFFVLLRGLQRPIQSMSFRLHKEYQKGTGTTTCFDRSSTKGGNRQLIYSKAEAGERSIEIAIEVLKQGGRLVPPEQIAVRIKDPFLSKLQDDANKTEQKSHTNKERRKRKRK